MSKQHEITTINDIFNVTDASNLEAFLIDLKGLLATAHTLKSMHSELGIAYPNEMIKTFKWIDDGKHDSTITVEDARRNVEICTYISNDDSTYTPLCDGSVIIDDLVLSQLISKNAPCQHCGLEITTAN